MKPEKQPPGLASALRYAELGWSSFAVARGKKVPAIRGGFKSASKDRGVLAGYWRRDRDANVGVATGDVSGIMVLDIDPRNGGDESFAALKTEHGELPKTVEARTGGGGRHFFFRAPDVGAPRCSAPLPGIDIKANGGYVVAAPSVHPSGEVYRWVNNPFDTDLVEAPDWLLKLSQPKATVTQKEIPAALSSPGKDAAESVLGKLFKELGLLGRPGEGGKRLVVCPWESEHSTGETFDSSTVLFPESKPGGLGGFHCSHAHCTGRSSSEALDALRQKRDEKNGAEQWFSELKRTVQGGIRASFRNVCLILNHDKKYGERLRSNEMLVTINLGEKEMTDAGISRIRVDLDSRYGIEASEADVMRAVHLIAEQNKFHPVRDFLKTLTWDGVPRIHRIAEEVLRVRVSEPGELELMSRLVSAWFLTLAGRPLRPGIKVDTALILQGAQGTGKSSFFRILGGDWFNDTEMGLDKDGIMLLAGVWLCEWAELENVMSRSAVSKVKQFLASSEDRFRPPFGRTMMTIKRSGVIVGTTNLDDFLHDPTGSRRFWVIPVGKVNTELLSEWRTQLLAEAVARFNKGEQYWLTEEEETRRLAFAQQFADVDPWEDQILQYTHGNEQVRIPDILKDLLGIDTDRQDRRQQHRVAGILKRHGWTRTQRRINDRPTKVWVPPRKKEGDLGD